MATSAESSTKSGWDSFANLLGNIAGGFYADRSAQRELEIAKLGNAGYLAGAPAVSTTPGASAGNGAPVAPLSGGLQLNTQTIAIGAGVVLVLGIAFVALTRK